ncbi:PREDICTED: uncharacterized protein LOC107338556 [Acropora digitifera]|uniref:uncharacterized protein LOC107338556 n=1 Tax=Acropora digitifera TaxID=70779 RepID=UPI000779FFFC|nr:PREDICTED: uncharacterized protein LOC107338556 [Acropora digitifera]
MSLLRIFSLQRDESRNLKRMNTVELEKELFRRRRILNEHEERIFELWNLKERKLQSQMRAKEQQRKLIQEWIKLTQESIKLEKAEQKLTNKKIDSLRQHMETRRQLRALALRNLSIRRKFAFFWKTPPRLITEKKKQKWRENLRLTRSESDMNRAVLQIAAGFRSREL